MDHPFYPRHPKLMVPYNPLSLSYIVSNYTSPSATGYKEDVFTCYRHHLFCIEVDRSHPLISGSCLQFVGILVLSLLIYSALECYQHWRMVLPLGRVTEREMRKNRTIKRMITRKREAGREGITDGDISV